MELLLFLRLVDGRCQVEKQMIRVSKLKQLLNELDNDQLVSVGKSGGLLVHSNDKELVGFLNLTEEKVKILSMNGMV